MNDLFETKVKPEAMKLLKRAIMPESKEATQKMTNHYLNELSGKRYRQEGGEIIVTDNEGNPIENAHGYNMTAQDAVSETFDKYFSDNGLPRTADECYRRLRSPNITTEERIRLTRHLNSLVP